MKILLVSVGGTAEPIIHSINQVQPDKLIAFCSVESRDSFINSVLPATFKPEIDRETILAPDIQDLVSCVKALHVGVPEKLKLFRAGYEDLIVDYTGGTKTMSVAMAMALCDKVGTFVYIGGKNATRAVSAPLNREQSASCTKRTRGMNLQLKPSKT